VAGDSTEEGIALEASFTGWRAPTRVAERSDPAAPPL